MTISSKTTLVESAFIVCTTLDSVRQTAVLTGGAAAQFYAPSEYQSRDLDFVLSFFSSDSESRSSLEAIGFQRAGRNLTHPNSPFTVEFPPGPLMVGDDVIRAWDTVRRDELLLHIITPTDSVRDRLAAYMHWNDLGSLEVALAVARAQTKRVDRALIKEWCRREGAELKFNEFSRRLRS